MVYYKQTRTPIHKLSQIITNNQEEKEYTEAILTEHLTMINLFKLLGSQLHSEAYYNIKIKEITLYPKEHNHLGYRRIQQGKH